MKDTGLIGVIESLGGADDGVMDVIGGGLQDIIVMDIGHITVIGDYC